MFCEANDGWVERVSGGRNNGEMRTLVNEDWKELGRQRIECAEGECGKRRLKTLLP